MGTPTGTPGPLVLSLVTVGGLGPVNQVLGGSGLVEGDEAFRRRELVKRGLA